ncbi:BBP7 family outer membrane beta-barrel protein [Thalassoglobus sp. JC818]|uniref:BBP7 family outer membrane beta-barrel protein n=1 Tax=Thalassoglobus sp. JC818 TaxID=3232136 RepID=UPI0034591528
MTRWLTAQVLLISGLLPMVGYAQDQWMPPQAYGVSHGEAMPPGHYPMGSPPPEYWDGGEACPPSSPLYADLFPKERCDFYRGDSDSRLLIESTLRNTWIRYDYLNWGIGGDNTRLGAPVLPDPINGPFDLSGRDRDHRLNAQDRVTGLRPFTTVIVPKIGDTEHSGLNGSRLTVGVPMSIGELEANIWILEEAEEVERVVPFNDMIVPGLNDFQIGAITLLEAGQLSNSTMILFSESYRASLATRVWGTEFNMVCNPLTPNVGIEVRPILGIQYINLSEDLLIAGQDVPDPGTILNHRIDSHTQNHVFGPQVGVRFVSQIKRLTLATDAKFLFGVNRIENELGTRQLFAADETPRNLDDARTRFAPTFDFSVSAKCQATKNLSMFIAYELLVGGGYARAYDSLYYNSAAGSSDPPAITIDDSVDNFYAHGLVLGVELAFQ